jgi:hypothetical protein
MTLLRDLSDEELDQYARIADDQMRREDRLDWAQVAIGILAIATLVWTLFLTIQSGFDRGRAAAAGLASVTLYWPYRKAKARRIWREQRAERARRSDANSDANRAPAHGGAP